MSPIGRVFIVLNLFLAGGFAVMAGQLLNKQANYKQMLADETAAHEDDNKKHQQQIEDLKTERGNAENAKTSFETQLAAAQTTIGNLQDENKRLAALTSSQAADLKKAYRMLALKLHPDKNKEPCAEEAFKRVEEAHRTLADERERYTYDASIGILRRESPRRARATQGYAHAGYYQSRRHYKAD